MKVYHTRLCCSTRYCSGRFSSLTILIRNLKRRLIYPSYESGKPIAVKYILFMWSGGLIHFKALLMVQYVDEKNRSVNLQCYLLPSSLAGPLRSGKTLHLIPVIALAALFLPVPPQGECPLRSFGQGRNSAAAQ